MAHCCCSPPILSNIVSWAASRSAATPGAFRRLRMADCMSEMGATCFVWTCWRPSRERQRNANRYIQPLHTMGTELLEPPLVAEPLAAEPQPSPNLDHRGLRRDEFWRVLPAYQAAGASEFHSHPFQVRHTVT